MCCYARQDKHWATGPDGQQWENYVLLADAHSEPESKTAAELTQLECADDAGVGGFCASFRSVEANRAEAQPAPAAAQSRRC